MEKSKLTFWNVLDRVREIDTSLDNKFHELLDVCLAKHDLYDFRNEIETIVRKWILDSIRQGKGDMGLLCDWLEVLN